MLVVTSVNEPPNPSVLSATSGTVDTNHRGDSMCVQLLPLTSKPLVTVDLSNESSRSNQEYSIAVR
jgi:hypothetical protein